ncbi:MAG: hypothetical protein VW239_11105 [Candidatus Nanopelagicales bacterium]
MADPGLLLVDIDGVLADVTHRQHHLDGPRKNWSAFFAAAADDPLIEAGAEAVRQAATEGHRIVYLTGRPERLRQVTESWLVRHGLPVSPGALQMRPHRDWRPAADFKVQVVRHLARGHTVADMWDDDEAVVEAIRSAGFPAQVPQWAQPRSSAFIEAQDRLGRS